MSAYWRYASHGDLMARGECAMAASAGLPTLHAQDIVGQLKDRAREHLLLFHCKLLLFGAGAHTFQITSASVRTPTNCPELLITGAPDTLASSILRTASLQCSTCGSVFLLLLRLGADVLTHLIRTLPVFVRRSI